MSDAHALVSLLTPTRDRRAFFEVLCSIVSAQTYPRDFMEWVVVDDGDEPVGDILHAHADHLPVIEYIRSGAQRLGAKRQIAIERSKGDILVHLDDDDYYPPQRVQHAVDRLSESQQQLAGSSLLPIWDIQTQRLYRMGPFHDKHATCATFAFTREYTHLHRFPQVNKSEESGFTDGFREEMVQLDAGSTIVCISHAHNTVRKDVSQLQMLEADFERLVPNQLCRDFYRRVTRKGDCRPADPSILV